MKTKIAVIVVLVLLVVLQVAILSCSPKGEEARENAKEVKVKTGSNYVFKKIYVKDNAGYTHEILTASSGNAFGGVSMLELCVYKEN